jgi:transcriptional regulator of acetoin/glycerol metabolism
MSLASDTHSQAVLSVSAARAAAATGLLIQSLASDAHSQTVLAVSAAREASARALVVQSLASDTHSQAARTYSAAQLILDDTGSAGVVVAAGQLTIKKNVARANFAFPMFDSTGALKTGLTVTAAIRKDAGASFAALAGSVTEIGTTGWYTVDFAQTETNADTIAFSASATGANPTCFTILTQA